MNVLQGLDLVHIKVLGILSTDYSSSSPKQVFFLKSAFNVRLVSDTSHTKLRAAQGGQGGALSHPGTTGPRGRRGGAALQPWGLPASTAVRLGVASCCCQQSLGHAVKQVGNESPRAPSKGSVFHQGQSTEERLKRCWVCTPLFVCCWVSPAPTRKTGLAFSSIQEGGRIK